MGNSVADGRRELIRNMWNERIQGTKRNVEVDIFNDCYCLLDYFSK